MNKEIKEAMERIGSLVFSDIPSKLQLRKDIATIRTILEAYGKPKTVTREWVENKTNRMEQLFMNRHRRKDREFFISHEVLKEQGIEVEEGK